MASKRGEVLKRRAELTAERQAARDNDLAGQSYRRNRDAQAQGPRIFIRPESAYFKRAWLRKWLGAQDPLVERRLDWTTLTDAGGIRHEVARFGDLERILDAGGGRNVDIGRMGSLELVQVHHLSELDVWQKREFGFTDERVGRREFKGVRELFQAAKMGGLVGDGWCDWVTGDGVGEKGSPEDCLPLEIALDHRRGRGIVFVRSLSGEPAHVEIARRLRLTEAADRVRQAAREWAGQGHTADELHRQLEHCAARLTAESKDDRAGTAEDAGMSGALRDPPGPPMQEIEFDDGAPGRAPQAVASGEPAAQPAPTSSEAPTAGGQGATPPPPDVDAGSVEPPPSASQDDKARARTRAKRERRKREQNDA